MATIAPAHRGRLALAGVLLAGCVVAVALGVYARAHQPVPHPLFLAGFSGALQFKTWFATGALVLVLVQLGTALRMWGRLGSGPAPQWVAIVHRYSGALAFVALVPVAVNCLYSLGFATYSLRALAHSVAGCTFYGAYTAKMLGLRVRGLPGWALPVLGGLVFAAFMIVWLTSAAWFLSSSGRPLT